MLILVFASAVIAQLLWQWYWRWQCLAPGNMGWILIGESLEFVMDIRGFIRRRHARFGPEFRTHLFGYPTIFLSSISDAKLVLLGEGKIVNMQLIEPVHRLMEGSLLTEHGEVHKRHRSMFYSMTKPDALKAIAYIAVPLIRAELGTWPSHTAFDVSSAIRGIVFQLSQIAVFGEYSEIFRQQIEPLFMTFNKGMFALPLDIPWTNFGKAMKARQRLRLIIENEVRRRREHGFGAGLLSVFLNDGDLSTEQIMSQTMLATLAGFETTSFTIGIAAHTLAKLPDVVNQLRKEQQAYSDTEYVLLKQQTLLSAAIKDSMRLFPTVPISGRVAKIPFRTTSGIRIPSKWRIFVGLDALSTMFSQEDNSFSLQRWQSEANTGPKWEVASFGAGPRDCVGAELGRLFVKLVLNEMIRKFNWRLASESSPISKHSLVLNLRPENDLKTIHD